MQAAAAGTGVRLSDGSTNVLPVGDAGRGTRGWATAPPAGHAARWSAASTRAGTCTRPSCRPGTPRRSRSTASGFADGRPPAARLRRPADESAIIDEPATARALAGFLLRGLDCGALDHRRARRATGLDLASTRPSWRDRDRRQEADGWGSSSGANQYGKAENRVVRIYRDTDRHEIRDLNVSTALRGDFARRAHRRRPVATCCPPTPRRTPPSLRQGARRRPRPRTTPIALGGRLLEATPGGDRRAGRGRGVRLGPDRGRTAPATTTRSYAAAARSAPSRST